MRITSNLHLNTGLKLLAAANRVRGRMPRWGMQLSSTMDGSRVDVVVNEDGYEARLSYDTASGIWDGASRRGHESEDSLRNYIPSFLGVLQEVVEEVGNIEGASTVMRTMLSELMPHVARAAKEAELEVLHA